MDKGQSRKEGSGIKFVLNVSLLIYIVCMKPGCQDISGTVNPAIKVTNKCYREPHTEKNIHVACYLDS